MANKLNFIILCDKAFFEESTKKLNIMGTFDSINASGFPAVHPFMSVVIGIEVAEGFHNEVLKIKRNMEEVLKVEAPFSKTESGKHQFIHNLINTKFPEEGEYISEVYLDGSFLGSTKFYLKKI